MIRKFENSYTWNDLERSAEKARELLHMSGILEAELMDVLNRIDVKITFNPRRLGRFWREIIQKLQWNYTYEYSQNFSLSRTNKHELSVSRTLHILKAQLKKSKRELMRKEARKAKLLENL